MSTYKQKTTLKNNTWPTQTPYKPKVISGAPEGLAYPALHAAFVVLSQAGHCKIWYKVKSGMRTGHLITFKGFGIVSSSFLERFQRFISVFPCYKTVIFCNILAD